MSVILSIRIITFIAVAFLLYRCHISSGGIKYYGIGVVIGYGDDEQIEINLDKVPANISKLAVIINIYSAYSRQQNFGEVKNCFVHASDLDSGKELVRYDIDGNFNGKTGIFVADIYRYNGNGEWKFKAIGEGVKVANIKEMAALRCK